MPNKKYLIKPGQRFNRLVVIREVYITKKGYKHRYAECICDCGKATTMRTTSLFANTQSCGCLKDQMLKSISKTHGKSRTSLYYVLTCMKNRCYRKELPDYKNYGARGIVICDEWMNDFMSFYNWAMDNGYKKGLTIERKDNDKGYSPENCCFVTRQVQCNNKRDNHIVYYKNEKLTLMNFCRKYNINYGKIEYRLRYLNMKLNEAMIDCGEYAYRDQSKKKVLV